MADAGLCYEYMKDAFVGRRLAPLDESSDVVNGLRQTDHTRICEPLSAAQKAQHARWREVTMRPFN